MPKTSFIAKGPVELIFSGKMEQSAKPPETAKPKSRTVLYVIILVVLVVVGAGVYILFQPKGQQAAGTGCKLRHLLRQVRPGLRSEEHTSELQSQSNLVCRL